MSEEQYDGGDPEQVKAARREDKLHRTGRNLAIRRLMQDPDGRRFVWDILADCGVFRTPFAMDPYATAFNAGKQSVGQMLLAEVTAVVPELYIQMLQEPKDEENAEVPDAAIEPAPPVA
jgi:hypothetical protein